MKGEIDLLKGISKEISTDLDNRVKEFKKIEK
jgi:hypothetical protein